MEIKYLKLIKTIADEGSISGSADQLYLTQSAISHQLRDIEERLGFKVFVRSRNKWELTKEGEELYQLAVKVLGDIENSINKIHEIQQGSRGKVRISTECYSFYHWLPKLVQKTALLYPQIEIDLDVDSTHHPVEKLQSNDLDIAITTSKVRGDESLAHVELLEDEVFAVINEEHPLASKDYLQPEDFSKVHLIIHSYPLETVSVYERFLKPNNISPAKITAIPLTEVSLEMVKANMGVMCIPKWSLDQFKIPESCVFKKLGAGGLKRKHYAVIRKEDEGKKYLQDFLESLKEEFIRY